jgi:acyl carrier protein
MAMTPADARLVLRRLLERVAPDIDLDATDPEAQLLEAGDLDSIDFIALMAALEQETGIHVRERDYPRLSTVTGFVDFVVSASGVVPSA